MAMLLLLLAVFSLATAFTTTDVYYVIADHDEQSCPPHQICHKLSHYISKPDSYFTSDITIIFLEGQHSFDNNFHVQVNNVRNLTLKGQGHQWPVAGPEETVMQSTVIINCTKTKGGFHFYHSFGIIVEGLTVVNCGKKAVFAFYFVANLVFHKNSIQHMTGYGLLVVNCNYVVITNCSYFHSALCNRLSWHQPHLIGGGVHIMYSKYNKQKYTLELSYSNITKCCNSQIGGGVHLETRQGFGSATVLFSHLIFLHNRAASGGGLGMKLKGNNEQVAVSISSCYFSQGLANEGGGLFSDIMTDAMITIQNTDFVENSGKFVSEISVMCLPLANISMSLMDSTIHHTITPSNQGVSIKGFYTKVEFVNTKMTFANLHFRGLFIECNGPHACILQMNDCQFENSHNVPIVFYLSHTGVNVFTNCSFSNNTGGHSVISIYQPQHRFNNTFLNCTISDNNMTGITLFEAAAYFVGRNVIQNNQHTQGAGIILSLPSFVAVDGELLLYNNTADKHGGAILVMQPALSSQIYARPPCSLRFIGNSSSVSFSGNRAERGGSDMYNAKLMGCNKVSTKNIYRPDLVISRLYVPHVGHSNTTSWYFDIPNLFMKSLHFSNTDSLSSMSSDPIMVCFCNNSNLPDCSDRTHRMQTYPGLEINTTIATVGYYGGTSPGVVLVSAQHARLVRYYGQNETTKCFQLQILLRNTSSTTARVDIRVKDVLHGLSASIEMDIINCPTGLSEFSGQCHCEPFLANNNVQCNVSIIPFMFLRSGNSWFAYNNNNNTQCVTGTTNCPFHYCNRSDISFDIMAPDRQCLGNRAGILCGKCQSHLSIMLGSNRCGTCSNWYLFLLPVFALAGIVLLAVLMFLNLSVSVGTINGLLFYANMVKLNEAFFFPNGSVPVVSQFISWLNLDLGIEVCLFDGLDGYGNTWLQFVFPAYLFLLMSGIIVGCRYSVWLCRLCGSHAVPALATLFLMSYTKILLTVTNALSMSQLPCNDSLLTVWSVDGNIEYGSGKHLTLVVFSCGVLVIGLAYPVLVLCAPLLERYSHKCIPHKWNPVAKFKPLLDAYGGPYKDKYRFWTGVTLMVRLSVTLTFSFTLGRLAIINACIITTFVMGILTFWLFANGVYKSVYLSSLEAFYLLNLFFLSTVSLAIAFFRSQDYQIATIISVCLSFIFCLITMVIHLMWNFDLKKIKRKLGFENRPKYIAVPQVTADDDDDGENLLLTPLHSPPSVVYGSRRGEHQFVLEFPHLSHDGEEQESSSPVLLEREPLLF